MTGRLLCALMLISATACAQTQGPGGPTSASLRIDASNPGIAIPDGIFGSNIQWENKGDGIVVSHRDGQPQWAPGALEALHEAHITNLRFPGGLLANYYDWEAGTGPVNIRPAGQSFARTPVPSAFGTDEFLRLCHTAELGGCITVNLSEGPEKAARWVEYVNGDASTPMGQRRAANGIEKPLGVEYWEIGNELYSPDAHGHLTATQYGEAVRAFSRAMKARDPDIKVGAHLEASFLKAEWMKAVFPHLLTWNEEVLKVCGKDIDFVILHFYVPFDETSNGTDMHRWVWSGPRLFKDSLEMVRALLETHGRPGIEVAVTEYSTFFDEKVRPGERIASTENALFTASMLFSFMREPDVTLAHNWSFANNSTFGLIDTRSGGTAKRRPTFEVFRILGEYVGGRLLGTRLQCAPYSVEPFGNIPAMNDVPVVDTVAVRAKDGTLRFALVNRDPQNPVQLTVEITGTDPPGPLQAVTLTPRSARDTTAWATPEPRTVAPGSDGRYTIALPPHSLTAVTGSGTGS